MESKNMQPSSKPPRWADRFLEWYCSPPLLEEIQGDAHELFYREIKVNAQHARLHFIWNVFRFFRWRNIRKDRLKYTPSTSSAMIKSYLLTGIRSMLRNSASSTLNIVGLSVAIGCAVLIFILEDSYYNLDAMHEKGDRIGLVVNHVKEGENTKMWARSPHSLATLLQENTAVENVARAGHGSAFVRIGDKVFQEGVLFADPSFFEIFSFKTIAGNRQCLVDKSQIMISSDKAKKFFGNDDVVGQTVSLKFNDTFKQEFTIGAILENTPANSSMYFDIVVPSAYWEEMNQDKLEDWSQFLSSTFLLVKDGQSFNQLESSLRSFKKYQNEANETRPVQSTEIIPLYDVAQRSFEIEGSLSWSNAPAAMVALVVIATFLVLLACFNYMNVAVASVSTRLKEIGVRKVVGGGKSEIIKQFLVENFVQCLVALVVGVALAYFILVPGFDSLYPIKVEFEVSSWKMVIGFFGGLLGLISIISGAYPALYVSSFNAVKILRGKEKFGSKSLFSRILLTIQFTLSITTIVACLVFVWSSYHFENKDWGYNQEQTVAVALQSPDQYEKLKSIIRDNKNIITIAGGEGHIGKSFPQEVIKYENNEYSVATFPVSATYLDAVNIRLKSGRYFNEESESDKSEAVIVNEAFVRKMGWTDPLKASFKKDSIDRYVIGVVEDFYYNNFFWKIEPAMFTLTNENNFRYLIVKAEKGSVGTTLKDLEEGWKKIAPDDPFTGIVQSEVFDNFLRSNRANNKVIFFISMVAVILAAMGLYGLVSYNLTRRLKEFSVRKVFGANTRQIFTLMNGDYIWIVLIAFIVGAPAGAYLMNMLLTSVYPEKIPTTSWPYIISILVMVMTVSLTMLSQLRRVVQENPTETLRIE